MTIISSDNEQTIDNQKEKVGMTAARGWTFDTNDKCEPSIISLMREYIEDAHKAMQSDDYEQAALFVRMAYRKAKRFTIQDNGDIMVESSKWETWPTTK